MTPAHLPRRYRFWWHERVVNELRYLRDHCDTPAYSVTGLALNLNTFRMDVARWVDQLIEWGEIVEAKPLWLSPGRWVALATEREAAA